MKKLSFKNAIGCVLAVVLTASCFAGCSSDGGSVPSSNKSSYSEISGESSGGRISLEEKETVDYSNTEITYASTPEDNMVYDADSMITYADNEIVISADDSVTRSDMEKIADEYDAEIVGVIEIVNYYQLRLNKTYSYSELLDICDEISAKNGIESAMLNTFMEVSEEKETVYDVLPRYTPNDELWSGHWSDSDSVNWGAKAINATTAWGYKDFMTPIRIGLIDTMFLESHDDLGFAETFYNYSNSEVMTFSKKDNVGDECAHGTHVAGIMAQSLTMIKEFPEFTHSATEICMVSLRTAQLIIPIPDSAKLKTMQ